MSTNSYTRYPSGSGGSGTVTSIGLTAPSIFTVTGSPVTNSGTIAITSNTQAANLIYAGPSSGVAAIPAFRAIVAGDLPLSSTSTTGALSSTDWNTFNNKQASLTLGNLTDVGTDGIVITGGTGAVVGSGTSIAQHVADATHNGYLSSTDWSTFNSKQSTLTPGSISTTTTGLTVGSGAASTVGPNVTVNVQTASTSQPGLISSTDWNTFNNKQASGNYITALTGDVVASGPGSVSGTIQAASVSLAKMANLAANSIIGNNTGSPATPIALTVAQVNTLLGTLTNPMSAVSDIIIGGASGTPTRLAIGGAGKVLRSDATNLTYSYPEPTIAAKVANYTTTANDNLVNCDSSGGTFTITLLAAATAGSGKRYIVRKTDSSLTAVTVSDVAATLTTNVATQFETVELYTDGASWFVLNRNIPSNWVSYTPTATGPGSNNTQSGFWKRVGDSMLFKMRIIWSGSPGTFTSIVMSLPSGITVDTAKLITSTTLKEWAAQGIQFSSVGGTTTYPSIAVYASTTTVQLKTFSAGGATYGDVSNSSPAAIQNTDYIEVNGNLPVSGWNG